MESPRPSIVFSPSMKWLAAGITIALAYILYTAVHDVALVLFGAAVFAYIFAPVVDFFAPYTRQSRLLATTCCISSWFQCVRLSWRSSVPS
jgi:predicted PurR-regulated permease PerM